MQPAHVHTEGADGAGDDADSVDEEARAASRKLAETQESALAQQTHRRTSTEERSIHERESFNPIGTTAQRLLTLSNSRR